MLICEGSGAITHSPRLRRNVKPLGERESLVCTLLRQANENKYRYDDDDDDENGQRRTMSSNDNFRSGPRHLVRAHGRPAARRRARGGAASIPDGNRICIHDLANAIMNLGHVGERERERERESAKNLLSFRAPEFSPSPESRRKLLLR